MQIGVVGLGRMGLNITRRLMKAGHQCLAFDVNAEAVTTARGDGATGASSLAELVKSFDQSPRIIWLMLPAGRITDAAIATLAELLAPGDIIVDGGNTHFKDDIRRAGELASKRIHYIDCGTSGGIWGAERGYCLMIGGPVEAVTHMDPIFSALAPGPGDVARTRGRAGEPSQAERGYIHAGPTGAGHFVKMIHNGIEYGLMQAYAEGFDIMRGRAAAHLPEGQRYDLNLPEIAEVWRRGSVISSWLLDLSASALLTDPDLKRFSGEVEDSGEGRWTIETAIEQATPANVLSASLFARFRSRQKSYADKLLSAMRFGFGGHVETKPTDGKEG
ncbi:MULTISPECIES: phosphogluconate dehydrogenase (NAD(+)-dependent, decarboxylating) [unclassified Beijerinckia]|uniref:phosphogluconate dehydrogenase (NAD(+)-dependent, decarboxylating) n=1 Tax=unclassified Beijerinckia TaxID=2638183 RepID=UPI000899C3AA|nr:MULTISPECIES: decarboxylating 6-phosphogluconate dehydrogenase [unclassified Beijerinckia]MDH7796063.1 6-phosphogluconate dehydrogenase [Beijerinckia sp. GAS462]SEC28643.1 6-phosphogluconate dehydrogenase (decarboxylating) [Beijerinckia sp. 28-YEA-48]